MAREVLNLYTCIIIKCEVKSAMEIKVGGEDILFRLSFLLFIHLCTSFKLKLKIQTVIVYT